jgi:hypothetical protein
MGYVFVTCNGWRRREREGGGTQVYIPANSSRPMDGPFS